MEHFIIKVIICLFIYSLGLILLRFKVNKIKHLFLNYTTALVISIPLIILGITIVNINNEINPKTKKESKEITKQEILIQLSFEDSVKNYIQELNIRFPDIVFNQARVESGNFTSAVFKENNNMFGMKIARQRPTTSIGENRGYSVYLNWKHSVIDYALLQAWSYKNLTRSEYLERLNNSYAEDVAYLNKIQ